MKIVQEKLDSEDFLELCLSPSEIKHIADYMIISKQCMLNGFLTNVGIKLELDGEGHENTTFFYGQD